MMMAERKASEKEEDSILAKRGDQLVKKSVDSDEPNITDSENSVFMSERSNQPQIDRAATPERKEMSEAEEEEKKFEEEQSVKVTESDYRSQRIGSISSEEIDLGEGIDEQASILHKEHPKLQDEYDQLFYKRSYSHVNNIYQDEDYEEYKPLFAVKENQNLDRDNVKYPDVATKVQKIEEVQDQVEKEGIENYEETFNKRIENDILLIGAIDVDVLEEEQKKIDEQRVRKDLEEATYFENQKLGMLKREDESKAFLFQRSKQLAIEIERKEHDSIIRTNERKANIAKTFMKAEATLKNRLKKSKGEIITKYGELGADSKSKRHQLVSGTAKERTYEINWVKAPQPIEIRIELLRSLKDKVPRGRYAILCSIIDRLGGNVLDYQNKHKTKKWKRITKPKLHSGQYYQNEIRFQECLRLVAPSQGSVRPSMILLFELFMLKSKEFSCDQVLGWGVFPLLNPQFEINQGKFKIPMMFGPVDNGIDKFRDIENAYRRNLDEWLCNMYFEITRRSNVSKYAVKLVLDENTQKHNIELLEHEEKLNKMEEEEKMERKLLGKEEIVIDIKEEGNWRNKTESSITSIGEEMIPFAKKTESETSSQAKYQDKVAIERALLKSEESDDDWSDEDEGKRKIYHGMHRADDYDEYYFNLSKKTEMKTRNMTGQKLNYILDEALADLGLRNVLSVEFWLSLFVLFLAMWMRLYLHFFGQWLLLKFAGIPVTKFVPYLYIMDLQYPMSVVGIEVGVIIFGNMFNTLLFLLLMLISWLIQKYIRAMPKLFSKFIASFGIAVVGDFILIAVVDIAIRNWSNGELFKLYNFYEVTDKNGVVGVFIILFIYFAIFVLNAFFFYNYLVFLHMEGRLIDIFTRLTGDITCFFIPHDNEISMRYLKWIMAKVKRENKGNFNNPKQISITYHKVSDKTDTRFKEETTYISIYKKREEDGKLILYRHFVRSPDGSLCELEEHVEFSVEEYPLLEKWPEKRRRLLVTRGESRQQERTIGQNVEKYKNYPYSMPKIPEEDVGPLKQDTGFSHQISFDQLQKHKSDKIDEFPQEENKSEDSIGEGEDLDKYQ